LWQLEKRHQQGRGENLAGGIHQGNQSGYSANMEGNTKLFTLAWRPKACTGRGTSTLLAAISGSSANMRAESSHENIVLKGAGRFLATWPSSAGGLGWGTRRPAMEGGSILIQIFHMPFFSSAKTLALGFSLGPSRVNKRWWAMVFLQSIRMTGFCGEGNDREGCPRGKGLTVPSDAWTRRSTGKKMIGRGLGRKLQPDIEQIFIKGCARNGFRTPLERKKLYVRAYKRVNRMCPKPD